MSTTKTEVEKTRARPLRRRSRIARVVILCLLLLLGWGAYMVARGPVDISYFANFLIRQVDHGNVELSVQGASVELKSGDGLLVVLSDVQVTIPGEVPVEVTLPQIKAPVDLTAFMKGEVHFSHLEALLPHLRLGLPEMQSQSTNEPPSMGAMMEAIDRVADLVQYEITKRKLERVDIIDGQIEIVGPVKQVVQGIDATLTYRESDGVRGKAEIAGRFGSWGLELVRRARTGDAQKRIAILVRDLSLAEVLNPKERIKPGTGIGLPVSIRFESFFSSEGMFQSANMIARATDGWLQLGKTTVRYDDVALALRWDKEKSYIEVDTSHIIHNDTEVFYSGALIPPKTPDEVWRLRVQTDLAQFGSSDIPFAPIIVDGIRLEATYDIENDFLDVPLVELKSGRGRLQGAASVDIKPDGPYVAFALEGEKLPLGLLKQAWPITIVPPARRWLIDHIDGGMAETFSFAGAIDPDAFDSSVPEPGWAEDGLRFDMTFSDGNISPVGDVQQISGVNGSVSLRDAVLYVTAESGEIKLPDGKTVDVPLGTFKITKLREDGDKPGFLDLQVRGGAREIGEVFNQKPFGIFDKVGLRPADSSGTGDVRILAQFPLKKELDLDEVEWQADVTTKNFSAQKPVRDHTISKANVRIKADPAKVAIFGTGILDGLPADIDLVIPLDGSDVAARQDVVLDVTVKQLKQRGIDLTSLLKGAMSISVDDRGEEGRLFKIDLKKTHINLEALNWTKSAGVRAQASFRLFEEKNRWVVQDLVLTSEGVNVRGSLQVSSAGNLLKADFSKFQLRPNDDARVVVRRTGKSYQVKVTGKQFDARGLVKRLKSPGGGSSGSGEFSQGVLINANIGRVQGFKGGYISQFSGLLKTSSKGLQSADLTGLIQGRSPLSLSVSARAGGGTGKTVEGSFEDAGMLLRFLDLYDRMRGGKGRLYVDMPKDDIWNGSFVVKKLSIWEDPAIRKLSENRKVFPSGTDGQIIRPGTSSRNKPTSNASFDRLGIEFTRAGDTLTITEGSLKGAVLGGTVTGDVNLKRQSLNLTGTFVPMYALNNFFANIPLFGSILGGEKGEGLLGVTYRISGSVSDPVLSVNPLSVIAPGVFRKMFEFQK